MAEQEKDPLFPPLPEDLKALKDDEVQKLLDDSVAAAALIQADDEEFLAGYDADEIIAELENGVEQIKAIKAENKERVDAYANYQAEKAAKLAEIAADDDKPDEEEDEEETVPDGAVTAEVDVLADAEAAGATAIIESDGEAVGFVEPEKVPVTAAAPAPRMSRTPPAPAPARVVVETVEPKGNALVASAQFRGENPGPLDTASLASLMRDVGNDIGPATHDGKGVVKQTIPAWQIDHYDDNRRVEHGGGHIVWDGPKTKVAGVNFEFPADRQLTGGEDDMDKVRAALPPSISVLGKPGTMSPEALTASGGICAPSTPFYGQVNFATEAEPVWDSLPVFQAARGGVNIPTSTYIADITTAISSISEANDAAGGTFATKSCQALDCPAYTETFVNIFAHCREYGNLNARTWPEKIAHENALTMASLSRVSETFMLDRIKALSVNVTNGAETLGALIYLVDAIVKARFGIIGRFRMPRNATFRALLPYWVPQMLALDTVQTPNEGRFKSDEDLVAYLRGYNIATTFYLDSPSTGTTQLPDAAQTAAAIDSLPDNVQWALYPDGAFLGIDSGSLELGIVRDSTLNSTNDFQVFGERFRNLARVAPAQAAYWVTSDLCANGMFPPAGTARTCD